MATRFQLRNGARLLAAGGVIAYPTEAVFGLGCDPRNAMAVVRLLRIKRRALERGLILIAAEIDMLAEYIDLDAGPAVTGSYAADIQSSWPGPVTWVLPAKRTVPAWLTGGRSSLAVRVTAHPVARDLSLAFGAALVSTSANRTGQAPARNSLALRRVFAAGLDGIVPGAVGNANRPTEIRDARSGAVLRAA